MAGIGGASRLIEPPAVVDQLVGSAERIAPPPHLALKSFSHLARGLDCPIEGEEFVLESLDERPHLAAMNSLSNGFFFIVALSWLLSEVCVSASAGNHLPLAIFAVGLIVMFSILGCIRLSTEMVEKAGPVFTLLLGGGILLYGLGSLKASVEAFAHLREIRGPGFLVLIETFFGSFAGSLLRLFGGVVVAGFGAITLLAARESRDVAAH